ncbi:Protein transport protein Sec24C [Balamuthia mandrillaris]
MYPFNTQQHMQGQQQQQQQGLAYGGVVLPPQIGATPTTPSTFFNPAAPSQASRMGPPPLSNGLSATTTTSGYQQHQPPAGPPTTGSHGGGFTPAQPATASLFSPAAAVSSHQQQYSSTMGPPTSSQPPQFQQQQQYSSPPPQQQQYSPQQYQQQPQPQQHYPPQPSQTFSPAGPPPFMGQQPPQQQTQQQMFSPPTSQHNFQQGPPTFTPASQPQWMGGSSSAASSPYGYPQQASSYAGGPLAQQFSNLGISGRGGPSGAGGPPGSSGAIDPSQIPSPVSAPGVLTHFRTNTNRVPPPPTSRYFVLDEGNCSPRFMRMSLYNVPCSADLLNTSCLPLGAVVQPLAEPGPGEDPIPIVDFGSSGPIRCNRCKGYINPFVKFVDGGRQYVCSLCGFVNEVPHEYFCPLEGTGRRSDVLSRPELSKGSVEFVATKEYMWKEPHAPVYLFVVDVSSISINAHLLDCFVRAIKHILQSLPEDSEAKVGFITFDTTVHFYNLKSVLEQPKMLVVPDVTDMFVPLVEGLLVKYNESKDIIDTFLARLPSMFSNTTINESVFGSALEAASMALEETGGKVLIFQCSLPVAGNGRLKKRDDPKLIGTDKESALYKPQGSYYTELGVKCAEKQVSVDTFLFSASFVDTATIGEVSRVTGGQIYHYPSFATIPGEQHKFVADLRHNILRPTGFEAVMRIRCSAGLSVHGYQGHFHMRNSTDLELAAIDCDKSIAASLRHDESLDEKSMAVLQCALLYTTSKGERRIRVHNISLGCTSVINNVFRGADLYAIANINARKALRHVFHASLAEARNNLVKSTVDPLAAYRKHCASATSGASQLILPESLKLLPIYTLSLLKSGLLRIGQDANPDLRVEALQAFNIMSLVSASTIVYPHLFELTQLSEEYDNRDEGEQCPLPPALRLSRESLRDDGIYLMDNGQEMFLWIGGSAPSSALSALFGVESLMDVDSSKLQLTERDNPLSARVCGVVRTLRNQTGQGQAVHVIQRGSPLEARFVSYFVEDKTATQMSYADFLCHLHRHIQNKLSGDDTTQKAMKAMLEYS